MTFKTLSRCVTDSVRSAIRCLRYPHASRSKRCHPMIPLTSTSSRDLMDAVAASDVLMANNATPIAKNHFGGWISLSSWSRLFNGGLAAGNPGGSGMNRASFACHGVHVVGGQIRRCFLPQTGKQLMHCGDPALRPGTISCADSLVHSSSGTRLRGTAMWDTKNVQGNSGNPPLHRPGQAPDSCNFLNGSPGVLVRFDSLGRQSVGKLVPRQHPHWLVP